MNSLYELNHHSYIDVGKNSKTGSNRCTLTLILGMRQKSSPIKPKLEKILTPSMNI